MKSPTTYHGMSNPQAQPRHTGIATFFRTAQGGMNFDEKVDIAIVGVPFDGGVTHRAGARHGPRAVREQSTLLRMMESNGSSPFYDCCVRDMGDCWIEFPYDLEKSLAEITTYYNDIHSAGAIPLTVGGDHSISFPILRAIAKDGPVGMIHIDAHCDTGDDYMGSRFHHGAPFRRAVEEGLLDPKRVVQIGIRGTTNDPDLWKFSLESGMRVISMDEFMDKGWLKVVHEALPVVGYRNARYKKSQPSPTYLSFDIDSLDPSEAPGTGTPEAGGIQVREVLRMLRKFKDLGVDFIGGDLVEVSPPFDNGTITSFNAASILFEMLCCLESSWQERRKNDL